METIDKRMAFKLQEEIFSEEKKQNDEHVKAGEKFALQIAIEERRRLKSDADEKKKLEKRDEEFAKKIILDEVDECHKISELCSYDEHYAKNLEFELKDEIVARNIQQQENDKLLCIQEKSKLLLEADEKIARVMQEATSKELDYEYKNIRFLQKNNCS